MDLFTSFWKNPFYTSQQGRRSQSPLPLASAARSRAFLHCCSTTLGQGTGAETQRALLPPHPPATQGHFPATCCDAEHKAQHNRTTDPLMLQFLLGWKYFCFTATNATGTHTCHWYHSTTTEPLLRRNYFWPYHKICLVCSTYGVVTEKIKANTPRQLFCEKL